MPKKRLLSLFLLVVFVSGLLAGCSINIDIESPFEDTTKNAEEKTIFDYIYSVLKPKTMYESCACIYITNGDSSDTVVSSTLALSMTLIETYRVILKSQAVQDKIHEKYPGVEYTLSLEPIDKTAMFKLVATSENPKYLEEICNMAVSLFCESLPKIMEGINCKIVDYATTPQIAGTN